MENGQRNGLGRNGLSPWFAKPARQSDGIWLAEPDEFLIPTLATPEVHAEDHAQKGSLCQAAPLRSPRRRLGTTALGRLICAVFSARSGRRGTSGPLAPRKQKGPETATAAPLPNPPARAGRGNRKGSCRHPHPLLAPPCGYRTPAPATNGRMLFTSFFGRDVARS